MVTSLVVDQAPGHARFRSCDIVGFIVVLPGL